MGPPDRTDLLRVEFGGFVPGNYQDVAASDSIATILRKAALLRPTPEQAIWQEEGLTAFIHFGINTFYDQEWGSGTEDPRLFDPSDLDPDLWVRSLRDAGFRTTIITLKHHDGFHLWPTRYSGHSVAASPWLSGRGDIARLFVDAARRHGMKVGFYLSPADSNAELHGIFGNGSARTLRSIPTLVADDDRAGRDLARFEYRATDYGAFFLNCLYEILTQYGQIHEVWLDSAQGNTAATETYDYPAFHDLIGRLQPTAQIAVGGREIRWVGNESGIARASEWATVAVFDPGEGAIELIQDGSFSEDIGGDQQLVAAVRSGAANRLHWWPTEADMRITRGWFAHPDDVPKTGTELLQHYELTYGRNSVMLLNVPPTTTGQFSPEASASIADFASERRKAYTLDHALGRDALVAGTAVLSMTNGSLRDGQLFRVGEECQVSIDLGEPRPIARVGLAEAIGISGQAVSGFTIEAGDDGRWDIVGEGGTIGAHRIVKLAGPVLARHWRVSVSSARGDWTLAAINLWEQLESDPGRAVEVFVDGSAPRAGIGTRERPLNSMEQFRTLELAPGAVISFRSGTDTPDADLTLCGYGTADAQIVVLPWGSGAEPTIGGQSLAARFEGYAAQGWSVRL